MINVKDYVLKVIYEYNGETRWLIDEGDDILSFEDLGDDKHIKMIVHAKEPVKIVRAELIYDHYFESEELFYGGGYQSWSTSKEYKRGDKQYGLRFPCNIIPIAKTYAAASGDSYFAEYGKDLYHSNTYTYLRKGEHLDFLGTLNDRTGYTVFYADMRENVFAIEKDVEGVVIDGDYELFNIVYCEGTYDEVFDEYFTEYPRKATGRVDHLAGYTSWYNYFQNITEDIIVRDLNGLYEKAGDKANIFQIDDGYESMVGDWLALKPEFPNGMGYLADEIHKKGYKAGIWLAPFAAQFKAQLVKEHPDWFVKDEEGKMIIGGFAWNGFYVLDIEKQEVREYIKHVFDVVFNEWHYDMVKLDFLYAVAIRPRCGKSRGQIMHEAMDFLRECCGDKIILGCGVPLSASFGVVDACRISCDVELSFKDKFYTKITNPEIISAKMAMNNSIFRRHLNGRIFANDPDVFFLRDDGMKPAKFTWEQKKLLAKINNMFGSVLFVSDNAGEYDEKKVGVLVDSFKKFDGQVHSAEYIKNKASGEEFIAIEYTENGENKCLTYNTITGKYTDSVVE
ncbi:MAG: alpha-galactosidase [Clostridia bacterium]|nr:alpha-galactosidase [Clostridia bacterium]